MFSPLDGFSFSDLQNEVSQREVFCLKILSCTPLPITLLKKISFEFSQESASLQNKEWRNPYLKERTFLVYLLWLIYKKYVPYVIYSLYPV